MRKRQKHFDFGAKNITVFFFLQIFGNIDEGERIGDGGFNVFPKLAYDRMFSLVSGKDAGAILSG